MTATSRSMRQTASDGSEAFIAVMGPTGSGKSSFINLLTGSNFSIGGGLGSCTKAVQPGSPFILDGRRVVLVDTPGFDDTTRSDVDVLNTIALFLATLYERDIEVAGVLYFHRISDNRMSGTPVKNFRMFRKLCGDGALRNVVIVTNMWGEVDLRVGEAREAELMETDIFFKPALKKGAQMARHKNTVPSAEDIVRLILNRDPLPLHIQKELVDEGKDISQTRAGQELNRELADHIRKQEDDIRILMEEMQQAINDKDEETRREKEAEARMMQEKKEKFEDDARRMKSDYQREKQELEARLVEAEREAERLGAATAGKFIIDPYALVLLISVAAAIAPGFVISELGATTSELGAPAIPELGGPAIPELGAAVIPEQVGTAIILRLGAVILMLFRAFIAKFTGAQRFAQATT